MASQPHVKRRCLEDPSMMEFKAKVLEAFFHVVELMGPRRNWDAVSTSERLLCVRGSLSRALPFLLSIPLRSDRTGWTIAY